MTCGGVGELQLVGMQELAAQGQRSATASIDGIACYRIADSSQVDANLMRAPRFELYQQQRMPGEALQHAEAGARLASRSRGNVHLLAMPWITTNGGIYASAIKRHNAINERQIALYYRVALHLLDQSCAGAGVSGNDEQAGGILVQAVDDAGTLHIPGGSQRRVARQQRIDQRIIVVAWRGMHDHTGSLVDDQQVLICVEDIERQRLRCDLLGAGCAHLLSHRYLIAGPEHIAGFALAPGDEHSSPGKELLDTRA